MNKTILMGRLTRDPDVRYSQGDNPIAIARYTLAVDRRRRQGEEASADFISCVAMGGAGEFAEKYLKKGTKILVEAGFKQAHTQTKTDRKSTRLMSLSRSMSLQRAKVQVIRTEKQGMKQHFKDTMQEMDS